LINPDEKYKRRGKGYEAANRDFKLEASHAKKKHKYPKDCFNPDDQKNWLFADNPNYTKKRKSKKRKYKK